MCDAEQVAAGMIAEAKADGLPIEDEYAMGYADGCASAFERGLTRGYRSGSINSTAAAILAVECGESRAILRDILDAEIERVRALDPEAPVLGLPSFSEEQRRAILGLDPVVVKHEDGVVEHDFSQMPGSRSLMRAAFPCIMRESQMERSH